MSIQPGKVYKIKNVETGAVLGVSGDGNSPVIGHDDRGNDSHRWIAVAQGNLWMLETRDSNLFLSGMGTPNPGMPVFATPQQTPWVLLPDGEDPSMYTICSTGGPLAIELADKKAILLPRSGSRAQRFSFEQV